ncbi:hypothetical protein DVH24_021675 [Malus domestica]|uniref:Uncharacterized protein n=1 Tax=Malus domestica TaxID=3750 RepID=A0A498K0P9_MALDO|nr:hypothetical protein DVH24_021675 [Malus domestica]
MGSENRDFHICFFSLIAHSHMIPISNMAKLLKSQGVKTTTVTTPLNAPTFSKATQSSKTCSDGVEVKIKTIKFPSVELLPKENPSYLVVDVFFPRATDVAAKFIRRLIFLGTSFFAMATLDNMRSFYELKSVYANYYRNVLGMKAWHIGPVSMCNRNNEEKAVRGKAASIKEHEFLNKNRDFHICFFPYMAHGHMIPISDMAKLFASQGVKTTIVTTPLNAPTFSEATQSSKTYSGGIEVKIKTIKFPSVEAGLPEGCENLDSLPSPELSTNFLKATSFLQEPLEQLLFEENPSCLVADVLFPWATDAAAKFDIPRLIFHGTGFFAMAASHVVRKYEPFKNTLSDSDLFVIPDFPGEITMTRAQVPDHVKENIENDLTRMLKRAKEAEKTSYGIVVNRSYICPTKEHNSKSISNFWVKI